MLCLLPEFRTGKPPPWKGLGYKAQRAVSEAGWHLGMCGKAQYGTHHAHPWGEGKRGLCHDLQPDHVVFCNCLNVHAL